MNSGVPPDLARDAHQAADDRLVWGGSSVPVPAAVSTSAADHLQPSPDKNANDILEQDWGDEEPILRRPVAGGWA